MRIFFRNISLFIFPLLVLNIWFYSIVYSLYLKDYETVDLNFKTYFLADSRGTPLLKSVPSASFYNFAAPSDSYVDMKRKLEYLIDKSSIETLVITVDDHTLSKYREASNNMDRSIYFTKATSFTDSYSVYKNKYANRFFPILSPKGRDVVTNYFSTSEKEKEIMEWVNMPKQYKVKRCGIRIAYQFPDANRSELLAKTLKDIIVLCNENNIKLYGIKMPLAKEYIEAQDDKSYGAKKIFLKKNIEILDFRKEYMLKDVYFLNEDHLNKEGGAALTKLVLKKLNENE